MKKSRLTKRFPKKRNFRDKQSRRLPYLLLLCITGVFLTSCVQNARREGIGDAEIKQAQEKISGEAEKTMGEIKKDKAWERIHLQTVSFDPPENYKSQWEGAHFKKPADKQDNGTKGADDKELLFVKTDQPFDATMQFAEMRRRLEENVKTYISTTAWMYPQELSVTRAEIFADKRYLIEGKYPSIILGAVFGEGDKLSWERDAVSIRTAEKGFYMGETLKEKAGGGKERTARFERMFESIQFRTADFREDGKETADGFVRRYAGEITVEVPKDLLPARKFRYLKDETDTPSEPEKAKMMFLAVVEPDDQSKNRAILGDMDKNRNLGDNLDEIDFAVNLTAIWSDGIGKNVRESRFNSKHYEGAIRRYEHTFYDYSPTSKYTTVTMTAILKDKTGNTILVRAGTRIDREAELEKDLRKWLESFVPAMEREKK